MVAAAAELFNRMHTDHASPAERAAADASEQSGRRTARSSATAALVLGLGHFVRPDRQPEIGMIAESLVGWQHAHHRVRTTIERD